MMGQNPARVFAGANYLKALSSGDMRGDGAADVIHDRGLRPGLGTPNPAVEDLLKDAAAQEG